MHLRTKRCSHASCHNALVASRTLPAFAPPSHAGAQLSLLQSDTSSAVVSTICATSFSLALPSRCSANCQLPVRLANHMFWPSKQNTLGTLGYLAVSTQVKIRTSILFSADFGSFESESALFGLCGPATAAHATCTTGKYPFRVSDSNALRTDPKHSEVSWVRELVRGELENHGFLLRFCARDINAAMLSTNHRPWQERA